MEAATLIYAGHSQVNKIIQITLNAKNSLWCILVFSIYILFILSFVLNFARTYVNYVMAVKIFGFFLDLANYFKCKGIGCDVLPYFF